MTFSHTSSLSIFRFAGTLIKLRKWQELIGKGHGHSCAQTRWVIQAHHHILSLLPIYFDRIYTFASPLYGFDTTSLWATVDKTKQWPLWNEVVFQFLRQQEKAGNTAAVCLALETSSDARPDRGYQLGRAQSISNNVDRVADGACWHAMYLRSTMRLAEQTVLDPSPHAAGPLSSQASLLGSWGGSHLSLASPALQASRKKASKRKSHINQSPSFLNRKTSSARIDACPVLEYALDSADATTWPHSMWERVSFLLSNEKLRNTAAESLSGSNASFLLPVVRIYHVHEESYESELESKEELTTAKSSLFGFRWGDDQVQSMSVNLRFRFLTPTLFNFSASDFCTEKQTLNSSTAGKLPTKIFVARISDGLRLLIIVRGTRSDSDGNNQAKDGSVRGFLEDLANNLAPRAIFHSSFVVKQMKSENKRLASPLYLPDVDLSLEREGDDQLRDYLDHVKDAFGLQSASPLSLGESSRSRGLSIGRYTPTSPRRSSREQNNKMDVSAVALFLGPELGRYI